MNAYNRKNRMGQQFTITEKPQGTTEVKLWDGDKRILINQPISKMLTGWTRWIAMNNLIQDAFPFLSLDEREFLMSGTTRSEWAQMFGRSNLDISGHEIVEGKDDE
jgi:hypothetical protein